MNADTPTRTQKVVLEWPPGMYGDMEIAIHSDLSRGAIDLAIQACKRRGWLEAEGHITDAGQQALDRTQKN